ncbi:MAG TPA: lactonase family protein [Acidobacteriaceae bacterium]|nr:lactonase family protein [Acidobacteriaceae bacterium]
MQVPRIKPINWIESICVVLLCYSVAAVSGAAAEDAYVLFGSHSSGPQIGFSIARFSLTTGLSETPHFLLQASAPAYFVLGKNDKFLYTCNSDGFVSAYKVFPEKGELTFLNKQPTGGGDPSYVSLDNTNKYVFVANYQGGSIAAWALQPDGSLGERTAFIQDVGHSIDPKRQTRPFAHSIVVSPSNHFVLAADLGLDKIFVYRFDPLTGKLTPNSTPFAAVTPGTGPRHIVFHPNGRWVYVVTEMGSTVEFFRWNDRHGLLSHEQSISTLPADFHGASTAAEIRVSPDGRFLYTSNRGHDSITVFAIDAGDGRVRPIQNLPSGGRTPRNFQADPSWHWLLVTNQDSNNAQLFHIDRTTGKLTAAGAPVAVPGTFSPQFLVPAP